MTGTMSAKAPTPTRSVSVRSPSSSLSRILLHSLWAFGSIIGGTAPLCFKKSALCIVEDFLSSADYPATSKRILGRQSSQASKIIKGLHLDTAIIVYVTAMCTLSRRKSSRWLSLTEATFDTGAHRTIAHIMGAHHGSLRCKHTNKAPLCTIVYGAEAKRILRNRICIFCQRKDKSL